MQEEDELLDLVNQDDQVIGTIMRSETDRLATEKLGWVRAFDMYIINSDKKLWVPTRPAHKKIAPNGLDYSCGGHIGSGESYLTGGLREVKEELNLELKPTDLIHIKKFQGERYFREVYIYFSDTAPAYNPHDFVSAEWLSADELFAKLDAGMPAKLSIRTTVEEIHAQGYC